MEMLDNFRISSRKGVIQIAWRPIGQPVHSANAMMPLPLDVQVRPHSDTMGDTVEHLKAMLCAASLRERERVTSIFFAALAMYPKGRVMGEAIRMIETGTPKDVQDGNY